MARVSHRIASPQLLVPVSYGHQESVLFSGNMERLHIGDHADSERGDEERIGSAE